MAKKVILHLGTSVS